IIGNTLNNLKYQRIKADYKDKSLGKKDAEKAISRAKEILRRMNIPYEP
ncbi:MAG: HEPN domain-containing protein, partial [Candidatus Aminicenantes bacterium]|nr:HEPN domain-containing protein [Candidatus Aminicenantes bacterium]